jgi:hypothetical protein
MGNNVFLFIPIRNELLDIMGIGIFNDQVVRLVKRGIKVLLNRHVPSGT